MIYLTVILLKSVITVFVPDHQEQQQACGDTNGETSNIDRRITFVTKNVSDRDSKIIFDHDLYCLSNMNLIYGRSYSLLKLLTGFASAALIACSEIVTTAISAAMIPASKNIHQAMVTL